MPHTRAPNTLPRQTASLLFNFTSTQGYVPDERWQVLGFPDDSWRPGIADHYRFALARPELDKLLVSFGNVDHVAGLAEAPERGPLTADEERQLLDLGRRTRSAYAAR